MFSIHLAFARRPSPVGPNHSSRYNKSPPPNQIHQSNMVKFVIIFKICEIFLNFIKRCSPNSKQLGKPSLVWYNSLINFSFCAYFILAHFVCVLGLIFFLAYLCQMHAQIFLSPLSFCVQMLVNNSTPPHCLKKFGDSSIFDGQIIYSPCWFASDSTRFSFGTWTCLIRIVDESPMATLIPKYFLLRISIQRSIVKLSKASLEFQWSMHK